MEIKVRDKGRITLPLTVREALGVKEGNSLLLEVERNKLVLKPKSAVSVKEAKGTAKHRVRLEEIEEALGHEIR